MHDNELIDAHTIALALKAAIETGTPQSLWNMVNKMSQTGSLQKHIEAVELAISVNDLTKTP